MKKYFYTDGTSNYGPLTLEELLGRNISRDTKVWFQGLDEWKSAKDIPELREHFESIPPPVSSSSNQNNDSINHQGPPRTWLIESILVTLFCCLPLGIVGIVNAAKVESRFNAGNIAGSVRASEEAKKWTNIGFWIGLVFGVIYIILTVVASGY